MRHALHRAVLRRALLRLAVASAFGLTLAALLAPTAWFHASGEASGRLGLALGAVSLLSGPALGPLLQQRRPRARVTAPRTAASGA
ncbi:MAG: hypothetical protein ACO3JL_05755 [Myxococcota bacterium]